MSKRKANRVVQISDDAFPVIQRLSRDKIAQCLAGEEYQLIRDGAPPVIFRGADELLSPSRLHERLQAQSGPGEGPLAPFSPDNHAKVVTVLLMLAAAPGDEPPSANHYDAADRLIAIAASESERADEGE